MRRKAWFFRVGFAVLGVFLAANMAFGAGFALYEGSARGLGMGGTLVGRADDPSALFYNPAGITQLPGTQFMVGGTFIYPKADVVTLTPAGKTSTETESNTFFPPHLYSTWQYSDSVWFGLGAFSRFGLGTEYDEDWPGRYNIHNALLATFSINPNVAYKVNDRLSLAVGASAMFLDLTLERKLPTDVPQDIDQELTGDDWGYGYNVAAHYKACDWMSLGVSYTSQVDQDVDGDADYAVPEGASTGPGGLPLSVFANTDVSGEITLPDMLFTGVTFYPSDEWSLEFNAIWNGWSSYDELVFEFEGPLGKQSIEKDWDDAWRFQIGLEYKATDWLDLRLGYVFDESPIPDETADYLIPTNDRQLYSIGCGMHWDAWVVDLSYTYLESDTRTVAARPDEGIFPSKFEDGYTHLVGVSVSYIF